MEVVKLFNISFEFFPPKSNEGMNQLLETACLLEQCHPHFFSVTFGAGGSSRAGTIESVKMLQQHTKVAVAPHLACIGSDRGEILEILECYRSLGVQRIVALRGDLPSGMVQCGDFHYASQLISFIREVEGNRLHIEVAAYPEFHPQAVSAFDDVLNLKRKYDAGANSAITQYFFNPDAYFYYLDDCERYGIHLPIIPGIMPITQFHKLARFSDLCGAEIPYWIRKRLEAYGDDVESIKAFGIEVVSDLCQKLIGGGAPGLHFYTLNKAEAVLQILGNLKITPSRKKYAALQTVP